MRTLQEKYNGIQEGKFSKDQFLRDARLQLPNLVTQYNGYDDAVKILKNRGMIQEAVSTEESYADYSDDALTDMIMNLSRFDGNEDIIARVKAELARRREAKTVREVTPAQEKYRVKPSFKQQIAAAKKMIDAGKSEKEVVAKYGQAAFNAVNAQNLGEARLTKKSLTDYRYKPTNEMDNYPYEQILRGLRVELEMMGIEGTPTAEEYQKALAKVLKNLEKDEIFYTNQVAGVKANRKRTDLMTDATPKNEVDKENGLQKAQLKEAIKKVIKNILSEDLDPDLYPQDEEREERKSRYGQSEFGDGEEVYEMYADSDGDYEHDREVEQEVYDLYDRGQELYNQGQTKEAETLRQQALKKGAWLGWNETDLPTYDKGRIDYDDENFSDAFIDDPDFAFESVSLKDLLD